MATAYKRRHGVDWDPQMSDIFIDLTVAKKWREYKAEYGVDFTDPWIPLIDAAKALISDRYFKVPPWTEEHFHDWVMAEKGCITWGSASCGKALLPTEQVYSPDGVRQIGELKPGDYVMAATGHPVRVRGVYRQHDMPLYRVKFSDGNETICAKDHLWTIRRWKRVRWEGPRKSRKAVMGCVEETLPVDKLAEWSNLRGKRVAIPVVKPVEFSPRKTPLDPYVLGVLVGDGSLTQTVLLSSHTDDRELRDEVDRRIGCQFPGYGLMKVGKSTTSYMVVNKSGRRFKNPINRALRDLGLYGHVANDKFIPDVYKFNTATVRMDVLSGLFDTDGTVGKNGHVSFTTVSERLANDVKFMLESLGVPATITTKHTRGQEAYNVYLRAADPDVVSRLFKLSRKRSRLHSTNRGAGWRSVASVERIVDREEYSHETVCITIEDKDTCGNPTNGLFPVGGSFVVTHNSNDYGLLMLLDWITDPFDTVIRLGSTDKQSLKSRSWNAVVTYFAALKAWSRNSGVPIPGKFSKSGYAILNDDADDSPESVGEKAGIVGVAVNDSEDSGKLQGAHAKYVRIVIDELATITHHDNIRTAMQNLRVGAKDFRFFALANPNSWDDDSCQYCIPKDGISSVDVDTGLWTSTRGFLVRHHDGLKCITVSKPETEAEYPFLITKSVIEANLADCDGNEDSPLFWKMVRGFPPPVGVNIPTVLDPAVARDQRVSEPPPHSRVVACAAGIDPAWSEGGDGACYSLCKIRVADGSDFPILDFSDLYKLQIKASSNMPVLLQLREQVRLIMNDPGKYTAPLSATGVDSSGNQNLADELDIYIGGNGAVRCLAINNAERASDLPIRANTDVIGCKKYRRRDAEAWCVLADFCKAGQVRGLPKAVVDALTKRRFHTNKGSTVPVTPLVLEDKDSFIARVFKRSPDEADAAANAALAVKERLGILPYGWLPSSQPIIDQPSQQYLANPLPESAALDAGGAGYDGIDDMTH